MPKGRDRFREYVDYLGNNKWRCKFCGIESQGSATRIRAHLAGIPRYGITACEEVDHQVRVKALETFNGKGSGLNKSMGGTSGEGTERADLGVRQSVLPSDDASNPTDTQNSNRHGCALQQPSCNWLTGTGTASSCPQDQVSLPPSDMPLDNLDNIQQFDPSNRRLDAAHGNEIASSLQQLLMDLSVSPSLDLPLGDGVTLDTLLLSPENLHNSPPEILLESHDVDVSTFEEIQTNEVHMQNDSPLDVDSANRLQDCGQPCVAEGVPVRSNTIPVQHPGQLPPRCDEEDENDIRQFSSQTPMDIDPSTASQRTSVVDSLVLEAATNIIGPSSSHVFGSQSVLRSDDALNPNDTLNSNQLGCVPQQQSFHMPTGTGIASACPEDQGSLPPGNIFLDILDNTQQSDPSNRRLDTAHGNEIASSLQQLQMDLPLEQIAYLESGGEQQNSSERLELIIGEMILELRSTENPHCSLPENPLESRDVIVNTSKEIQTNEPHYPTVGSSLQNDSSLDVDSANCSQDCGQLCVVEGVPVRSNTSPTDTVQHPGQLPPRCDEEDGNDIHRFHTPTPMDIPITASQELETSTNTLGPLLAHASVPPQRQIVPHQSINLKTAHQDPTLPSSSSWKNPSVTSHSQALMDIDSCMPSSSQAQNTAPPPSHILPCGTDLTGLSSLPELDMNEGAPMMSHPNTGNNFEENRALKRKLELLYSKEAIIRDELDFAASLSLKEPRMEVVNLLASVEKLKNDCPKATSEDCLPPHQQVDILMHEAVDLMRPDRGLFEVRETKVGKLLEEKMVGEAFRRDTTKILEFLVGNQISRLGIYGMGGVGKTTIMVHIHNRLLEEANYGNVLWITVSQDFNTQRLQDNLWKVLGMGILQENDVKKRAAMLCDVLKERGKSTIILDDVWERFDVNEVGIPVKANGIKLVLTTRSFEVCRQMQCQEKIKIEPLSHIEAESLFLEELGSEETLNLETRTAVKSIVQECAGLPLAVIAMARSMQGVTDGYEWNDCLEKLRESDMGQTDMEKVVLKKLEFSYNRLGNHEIQHCFLSCALYPEDARIDKFELIEFFIDQGLIGRLNTREKQYVRGLTILNKLANVCLLEVHGSTMKMHDLIRDMALHIMSEISIVKAGKRLRMIPSEEYWTNALEKVSLMENEIREFPSNMSPSCPKLSTFLLNGSLLYDVVIPDTFFKQLWGLKVLNLSGCTLRELPDSISDLLNLTALLLRECDELHRIPHLGKLRSLRKLDIFYCVRVEVLEGLEMLVNLRYLDIAHTCIKRLPKGTLGALLNLQCLGAGLVNIEEITKLWALETLNCLFDNVDDFNKFVRVVSKQGNNPCYYKISVPQEEWDSVDQTNVGALFQYRERSVDIKRSHAIVSVRGESSGSGSGICILIPQDVRNLRAWNCDGVTNLSNMGPLEELEKLEIKYWSNLRVLCGGQDEEVINIHDSPTQTSTPLLFKSLRDLEIFKCPKLKYLFGHEPNFSLPHLRRIRITYCREMVGITVAATSPPPYPPSAFPSLEEIKVERCGKMKRVVEFEWLPHFPNLRRLCVFDSENMEEIIGGLSSYMSIEEISLEQLLVEGCHELPLHLQNLQTIQVIGCEGMAEMISGVGQGQEGSMTTPINTTPSSSLSSISLPKLNSLRLRNLPQLKSICEVPITCNSMGHLEVIGCQELNRIPLELQLRDIEDLPYIEVEGEEMWKTLIWDHPDAQANLQSHLVFEGSCCILEGRCNLCELSI